MLVLDTFNLLHTVGVLPPDIAGLDVPGLARLILRSRHATEKVAFVCDGLPAADLPGAGPLELPEHPSAAMEVRYSGRSATADDLIQKMIDASTAPRRLIVVSSDHAILRHARKRRCTVLTSEEFLQQLADDADLPRPTAARPHRPPMMSAEQVQGWMNLFAVDERALAPPEDDVPEPVDHSEPAVRSGGQLLPTAIPAEPTSPSPLPDDLIREAEAIWRSASPPKPPAQVPAAPSDRPAPGVPTANSSPAAAPTDSPIAGDDDLAALDMNAILPPDGRTHPLRKRGNRHRPS